MSLPTGNSDQHQAFSSKRSTEDNEKILYFCCDRRSFISYVTWAVGAGLLAGCGIRTIERPAKEASPATGAAAPCLSTVGKVPPPTRIEFKVQYPGKKPITLRGYFWCNQDAAAQGGKLPALVELNPYRSHDDTIERDSSFYPWFAYHGYLCFRVDLQGAGNSDGVLTDEYTDEELAYCTQVISQIAQHPRCNGNVGMMGWSWSAINSLMVAARPDCPAALKAILITGVSDDRFNDDVHYFNGAMLKDNVTWAMNMWEWLSIPPDPLVVGDRWKALWRERIQQANFWFKYWGEHHSRDSYWSTTSVRDHYQRVRVPVSIVSGYQDVPYSNSVPRVVAGLAALGKQVEGIIGPWGHHSPNEAWPGPQIDWLSHLVTHWWDKWLKGIQPAPEKAWPQLSAWLGESREPSEDTSKTETGKWVAEDGDWPKRTENKRLYLSKNAKLSATIPQRAASVGTSKHIVLATNMPETGSWGVASIADLPGDQADIDRQSLVFDSEPLSEDLDCFGYPTIRLNLSSDQPLTCLAVRLCEVSPATNASHLISYRFFNLCFRDGDMAKPRLVKPGEVSQVHIPLNIIGHIFKKGWRIRLSLSTSFFPTMWQTPEIAIATVYTGPTANFSPSAISLPVRKPRPADSRMAELFPPNPKINCVNLDDYITVVEKGRKARTEYKVEPITVGRRKGVVLRYINDSGVQLYGGPLQDLLVDGMSQHTIQIFADDPLSLVASSSTTRFSTRTTENEAWKTKTETATKVWTEKDGKGRYVFRYKAKIKAFIADGAGAYRLFEKRTDQGSIPRQWL